MRRSVQYGFLIALLFITNFVFAQVEVQEDLISDTELKLNKQYSVFGQIHSNGFGIGYRYGKIKSITKNNFHEFEFLKDKHPKAQKQQGRNLVKLSRRYVYGALNQLYVLRYGFGTQRILNEKPYWGGIQVDYNISGGIVLGLAIPQYLRILHEKDTSQAQLGEIPYYTETEKYDPNNPFHVDWGYIDGAGPLFRGLFSRDLRPYPGIYGKFGFNFDFGKYQERVNALEAGMMIDIFPIPIPMMAHLDKNFFFANFYIAYHFGRRK